ncbi:MAG: hypothetical protein ACC742_01640, partial [Thermoanaerobaculales bacterium]
VSRSVIVCSIVVLLAGTSALATAGDWQKLGSKAVAFNKSGPQDISIDTKNAEVSEVKLKVNGDWTRFLEIELNFADGSSQSVEESFDVEPGGSSDVIKINGGPKALASVGVSCQAANSTRAGRATIKIVGL